MPKRGMFANRHLGFRSSPDCALRQLGLERHVGSARLIDERSQFCIGRRSGTWRLDVSCLGITTWLSRYYPCSG